MSVDYNLNRPPKITGWIRPCLETVRGSQNSGVGISFLNTNVNGRFVQ